MKVLILCGGRGKTFWPISRDNVPKQFSKLLFDQSLFQKTLEFWKDFVSPEDIFAVATEEFRFFIKSQSIEILRTHPVKQITEKHSNGTLKAVANALLFLIQNETDEYETVAICNSDQIWKVSKKEFHEKISSIQKNLPLDKVVCIATHKSKHLKDKIEIEQKKDLQFKKFISFSNTSKLYNVGMYISSLKTLKDIIQRAFLKSIESVIEEEEFNNMPFEIAISRMSENAVVFVWDFEVLDIDDISDVSLLLERDQNGNYIKGDVVVTNTKNTTAISTKRFLAIEGVRDLNIIETPDVVYISSKNFPKTLHNFIQDRSEVKSGVTEYRPWGSYTIIDRGNNYLIKKITVNPGETLSLQLHYHRSEHWVVIRGTAKVTVEDKTIFLRENESTFIPKTSKHRLENPGKLPLEIIEIQIGDYIGEDDIVRFSDIYGRVE